MKYPLFFNTSTKRPFIETKRRNNFFFRRFSFVKRRSSKIESAEEKIQSPFGENLSAFRFAVISRGFENAGISRKNGTLSRK